MGYDNRTIGQIIGSEREKRKMTQEAFSGLAGISRSHLSMIENGRKSANMVTLGKIADAFGMRLSELICMVEEKQ